MALEKRLYATLCTENRENNPLVEQLKRLGYSLSFADPEPHHGIVDPTLIVQGGYSSREDAIAHYLAQRESRKVMLTGDDRL